jgi:hypothetical protein
MGRIGYSALKEAAPMEDDVLWMGLRRCRGLHKSLMRGFEVAGFVRIHRSVVVNLAHSEELRRCVTGVYLVRVSDGKKYTITRAYKNNLRFLADIWLGIEIKRANLSRVHFVPGCNFGLHLIDLCKELPYIGNQEIGLLQSREVSTLRLRRYAVSEAG